MDEKGANTFPFYNLPPELKKIISKVFPVLFTLSFIWIKEKSVSTLAIRTIAIKRKTPKLVLPLYHITGDSAGDKN